MGIGTSWSVRDEAVFLQYHRAFFCEEKGEKQAAFFLVRSESRDGHGVTYGYAGLNSGNDAGTIFYRERIRTIDETGVCFTKFDVAQNLPDIISKDKGRRERVPQVMMEQGSTGVATGRDGFRLAEGDSFYRRMGKVGQSVELLSVRRRDENEAVACEVLPKVGCNMFSCLSFIHGFLIGRSEDVGGGTVFELAQERIRGGKVELNIDARFLSEKLGDLSKRVGQTGGGRNRDFLCLERAGECQHQEKQKKLSAETKHGYLQRK